MHVQYLFKDRAVAHSGCQVIYKEEITQYIIIHLSWILYGSPRGHNLQIEQANQQIH